MEYILMIWNLPFEKISLHQMNLLKVVGHMIHNAITRSDVYYEAISDKRYLPETKILNERAFEETINTSLEISKRNYGEWVLICIESAGSVGALQKNEKELRYYNEVLTKNLRDTDRVGVGKDDRIYILLANSNAQEADIVIRRFASQGIVCSLKESV